VEAKFTSHPSVRAVKDEQFCSGGPRNSAHILAQALLAPGETRPVTLALDTTLHRVRSPQAKAPADVRPSSGGAPKVEVSVDAAGVRAMAEPALAAELALVNRLPHPALVVVERSDWGDQAATATIVTSFQAFRDLFSAEVLAPGQEVSIRSLAIMFTDLKGSTDMYRTRGDATAYAIVRDHFVFMTDIIASCRGAVVKTIGDAVMAAFPVTGDAVRAALRIQTEVEEWCAKRAINPPLALKVGVHAGPTIAVSSNGRLDYFGSTVNIAARLHEQSGGGDVLVTETVYGDIGARKLIDDIATTRVAEETKFRGFIDSFKVRRLRGLERKPTLRERSPWSFLQ